MLASRLWPETMAGQLVGLLCCGLLAAHALGVALNPKGGGGIHAMSRRHVIDTTVAAYRLARLSQPGPAADAALAALDSDSGRYRRSEAAFAEGRLDREAAGLHDDLRRRLSLKADAVRLGWRPGEGGVRTLALGLRLPDGGWLTGELHPVIDRGWWRPLRFSVPVSTVPVLLIVLLFVRRIVGPVRALAQAADRFSRGEYGAPLPVAGPREARELTAAFNIMQSRLARYLEDQRRMLGSVSHDLRSMVTTLRLRAELVEDEALRAAMQRTLREMAAMIGETLRFARDDAVGETTEDIDLAGFLRELVADQVAQGRDVALAPLAPLRCRCRPLALGRALTNLVENAVRYGGRARIGCAHLRDPEAGCGLEILIEDEGPGIPAGQLEQVFKPFYRLEQARQPELGGVGLGLAIARSCVEAHGGRLVLENRKEGGLRARIALPA